MEELGGSLDEGCLGKLLFTAGSWALELSSDLELELPSNKKHKKTLKFIFLIYFKYSQQCILLLSL